MKPLVLLTTLIVSFAIPCVAAAPPGALVTPDTQLDAVAAAIPGFGGMFYDASGVPNVHVVGGAGTAEAVARFGGKTRILPARFAWTQLREWRENLRDNLNLPGVIYLDIDEVQNRIVFGINRASAGQARSSLQRALQVRNVPQDAVLFVETEPAALLSTLLDYIHPQPGGVNVEIAIVPPDYCTLGFNIAYEPGNGFVSAAHCTSVVGQVDGDYLGYGLEERDPPFWSGYPCPSGRRCRYSDSALFGYPWVIEQGAGAHTAKTTAIGTCDHSNNSITIDSNRPNFIISGTQQTPTYNQAVQKVGRSSGWTSGVVTNTCVDTNFGVDITYLCQHYASVGAVGGDSGSPIFHQTGDGVHIVIDGLLWAQFGSCVIAFSDVSSIRYELGPMSIETGY